MSRKYVQNANPLNEQTLTNWGFTYNSNLIQWERADYVYRSNNLFMVDEENPGRIIHLVEIENTGHFETILNCLAL